MLPRSFFTFSRDGNFPFKFLCRIATSLFKKAQFLSPWEVYLSGISLIITSSICLKLELITLSAARAVFSTSFAAVHSFHSRRLISFSKFDLSIFLMLCFDKIPHEKADLHGLNVQIFLVCPSFKWQFPHADKCPLFCCDARILSSNLTSSWRFVSRQFLISFTAFFLLFSITL